MRAPAPMRVSALAAGAILALSAPELEARTATRANTIGVAELPRAGR